MKKKVLSLLLSTAMVASLAACGSTSADTTATTIDSVDGFWWARDYEEVYYAYISK